MESIHNMNQRFRPLSTGNTLTTGLLGQKLHRPMDNIDNVPEVEIVVPYEDDLLSGTVNITANATDDEGIKSVKFRIDDDSVWTDMTEDDEFWVGDWDSDSVEDGNHTIHVIAYDTIDQSTETMVNVTIDNTAPEIEIVGPTGFVNEVIN